MARHAKLPKGWGMARNGGKFAPVTAGGIIINCLGPGCADGGTRQQAIEAAHKVEADHRKIHREMAKWKIIQAPAR